MMNIFDKDDLLNAFKQGWIIRERFEDIVPDIIYPKDLDYEEKQEYAFKLWFEKFIKSKNLKNGNQ